MSGWLWGLWVGLLWRPFLFSGVFCICCSGLVLYGRLKLVFFWCWHELETLRFKLAAPARLWMQLDKHATLACRTTLIGFYYGAKIIIDQ